MSEKYNRKKDNYTSKSNSTVTVDKEVSRLFRINSRQIPSSAMFKLREKYPDENLLDQIQDAFIEKSKDIRDRARKFASLIKKKYSTNSYPLHILLKKALKYKEKYNLSDAEFAEFKRIYENSILGTKDRSRQITPITHHNALSQLLGPSRVDMNNGIKTKGDDDMKTVQQIVKLYSLNKTLHAQVVLQSMTYKDCAFEAIQGTFNREKNDPFCHVHPVIAALFLPKFDLIENHLLHANIGYIVKQRYLKEPIQTQNDYELFHDLVNDPTDVVCSGKSPILDLYRRSQLQTTLWQQVIALRNGKYYDCSLHNFNVTIDNCRRNSHDNPDMLYLNDEGTILQRLLGAFSLRPTICATTPFYSTVPNVVNNAQNVVPKVSTCPMITIRIRPQTTLSEDTTAIRNLNDAVNMPQWYVEDGQVMLKNQQIIYSRNMIIFYIPRRAHTLNISNIQNPYVFTRLPSTIANFERINNRPIHFPNILAVKQSRYRIRSVVCLEVNNNVNLGNGPGVIVGQSACIVRYPENGLPRHYWYNPRNANVGYPDPANPDKFRTNEPITYLDRSFGPNGNQHHESFQDKASCKGTIFIYEQKRNVELNNHLVF